MLPIIPKPTILAREDLLQSGKIRKWPYCFKIADLNSIAGFNCPTIIKNIKQISFKNQRDKIRCVFK